MPDVQAGGEPAGQHEGGAERGHAGPRGQARGGRGRGRRGVASCHPHTL